MREKHEKKGGGLMLIYKEKNVQVEIIETKNKDILIAKCKILNEEIKIILTYMAVNDIELNKTIMKEMQHNLNQTTEKCMILGDFNGHVGYLGPHPTNKNGEILLDFIDKSNLIMLNGHADCKGEITWEQKNRKSVIDYIIINKSLHNNFECMKIDEDKLEFDLSDHNLLTAQFHFNRGSSRFEKHRTKEINYLKINDVTKQNF